MRPSTATSAVVRPHVDAARPSSDFSGFHPLAVVTITSIALRRLNINPRDEDLQFVATITVGESVLLSHPTVPVFDPVAGMTLTFADVIECRVPASYDVRQGVTIAVASENGSVNLGSACCHLSSEWRLMSRPRGEVQVMFYHTFVPSDRRVAFPSPSLSSSSSHRGSDRPATAAAGAGGVSKSSTRLHFEPRHSAGGIRPLDRSVLAASPFPLGAFSTSTIPVRNLRISGLYALKLAFSVEELEPLFVTIIFCHQERQTKAVEAVNTPTGHSAFWSDTLTFEIPTAITDFTATVKLWHGNTKASGKVIGQATTLLEVADGLSALELRREVVMFLPQLAHSRLVFVAETEALQPRLEGSGGRPMSAFTRDSPPKSAVASARHERVNAKQNSSRNEAWGGARFANCSNNVDGTDTTIVDDDGGSSIGSDDEIEAFRQQQAARRAQLKAEHQQRQEQHHQGTGGDDDSAEQLREHQPSPPSKSREGSASGRRSASYAAAVASPSNDVGGGSVGGIDESAAKAKARAADLARLLDEVEETVFRTLTTALAPVMTRLEALEKRLRDADEQIASLTLPTAADDDVGNPREKHQQGSASSSSALQQPPLRRPATVEDRRRRLRMSSAATAGGGDMIQPVVAPNELRREFEKYLDVNETSAISRAQLLHFYRTHNSFAVDESNDQQERELRRLAPSFADGAVCFEDFCRVALHLAKM